MKTHPPGSHIAVRYEVAGRSLMGGKGVAFLCLDCQEQRPAVLKIF